MVDSLNKLITAIIIIFPLTFIALVAEILYILCRRRHQHQTTVSGGGDSVVIVQSKKRVHFFCWRKQSRIEPNEIRSRVDEDSDIEAAETEEETEEKWRKMYGQSRVLFTIKEEEEEREGTESMESDETPFYTPSPSPVREIGVEVSDENEITFLGLEIRSQ